MKTKLALIGLFISVLIITGITFYIKNLQSSLDEALLQLATIEASNSMLKMADDVGRVITYEQLRHEQMLREQADEKAHELQRELSNSDCTSVRLPTNVLDRLRE